MLAVGSRQPNRVLPDCCPLDFYRDQELRRRRAYRQYQSSGTVIDQPDDVELVTSPSGTQTLGATKFSPISKEQLHKNTEIGGLSCRHTFASRLGMQGANDRTLMALGVWEPPAMLSRHAHLSPTHLWKAIEGLTQAGTVAETVTAEWAGNEGTQKLLKDVVS